MIQNKRISRKLFAVVTAMALCMLCLLSGCHNKKIEVIVPESTPDPVRALTCISPVALPTLLPIGNATVLACWCDYSLQKTYLVTVDTAHDFVLLSAEINGSWDLLPENFSDGAFALCDREHATWRFFDADLQPLDTFAVEDVNGYFSHDRKTYYFLKDRILCGASVADGQIKRIALPYDLRISELQAIHPTEDKLVLQFLMSSFTGVCGTAILDLSANQYEMMRKERYQPTFTENGLSLSRFEMDKLGYSVFYEKEDKSFGFADADLFQKGAQNELLGIPGTTYLLGVEDETLLYALTDTISSCSLTTCGISGQFRGACWLPETQSIVGTAFQQQAFVLYSIAPSALTFQEIAKAAPANSPLEVYPSLADVYWGELSEGPVLDNLQDVRQYADRLEKRYDVRILLSSQCKDAASLSNFRITTTDQMDLGNEPQQICRGLEALDQCLALYPKDFFQQMHNSMGEGGIRFLLVGEIDSGYGTVGCSFENSDFHNIAIDVRMDHFGSTICHEIWHATEDKITSDEPQAFDANVWAACNPDGFRYYGDATLQDPDDQRWTLFSTGDEGIYFVDGYARVNEKEDRARIMEYLMTKEADAKLMVQSPAMVKKIQIMCDAVRRNFDTSNWMIIWWERLLNT